MTSASKGKGNRFEYDVRDMFNKVYEVDEFARTPGSGAIMGLGNFDKNQNLEESVKKTLGSDIICPEWFRFSVECKSYKADPNHSKVMREDDTTLNNWIGETLFDAVNLNLAPMLFFKTTRKGAFMVLPHHFLCYIQIFADYYTMYNGFVIVAMDWMTIPKHAHGIVSTNEMVFNDIHSWMLQDERPQSLIEQMLESKKKKKKK